MFARLHIELSDEETEQLAEEIGGGGGGGGAETVAIEFARSLLARDPHTAGSCFSPSGRILSADGTVIGGRDQIVEVLTQITTSEHALEIRPGRTICAETVALASQYWRRSARRGNHLFDETTVARLLLIRKEDRWQIAIASPWN